MTVRVLYFARLREWLGRSEEEIGLPAGVEDVAGLQAWLAQRGDTWQQALSDGRQVRAAVNQALATAGTPVADGDEIAFFPPVTGG